MDKSSMIPITNTVSMYNNNYNWSWYIPSHVNISMNMIDQIVTISKNTISDSKQFWQQSNHVHKRKVGTTKYNTICGYITEYGRTNFNNVY